MQLVKSLLAIGLFSFTIIQNANSTCITGNCFNGKGTYLYSDGSKYTGTFSHGKPHGSGVYTYKDGHIYQGEFYNGKKHGLGKEAYRTKDVYKGNYSQGKIEGKGTMAFHNGDVYTGDWVNEKPEGEGRYDFRNGDVYIGHFFNGKLDGHGRLTLANQSYYDGTWANNKKHGEGESFENGVYYAQIYKSGSLISQVVKNKEEPILSASSNDDQPLKDCTYQYCDQENGSLTYGDGSVYKGYFINGQGEGEGMCTYANGDMYKGGWKNHAPHGTGTMFFQNGNIYSAIWDNGVPKQRLVEKTQTQQSSKPISEAPKKEKNSDIKNEVNVYALVVGVATYNHLQSLKYTDDDAYQFYALLKSPEGGAIPDKNVKILIDDAATSKAIRDELSSLASQADANDVVLLYMSGHGLDGAFVPSDFDGYKNHIPYDDILAILNTSAAKHKLFITDACHSGSMLAAARSPFTVALENFYSAYNSAKSGTAVIMSSKKEEVSLEYGGLRQGVFSHFLIRGMKGEADDNHDKLITVTELYDYVSKNVKFYTANAQNPVIMGDYDPEMPVGLVR
ncbi:MAG: caspase family protein [Lewinellaceae bacterium]|nr:caspase family protein [Lewinellaceae bacterium]